MVDSDANGRLVDEQNTYHLYVNLDPAFRLPFSIYDNNQRRVSARSAFHTLKDRLRGFYGKGDPVPSVSKEAA